MPERSSKKKRPRDLNKMAASIVADAVDPSLKEEKKPEKNPAAVALGRLGGLKGGKARAAKLSPKKRKAIAKKAAEARWKRGQETSP